MCHCPIMLIIDKRFDNLSLSALKGIKYHYNNVNVIFIYCSIKVMVSTNNVLCFCFKRQLKVFSFQHCLSMQFMRQIGVLCPFIVFYTKSVTFLTIIVTISSFR